MDLNIYANRDWQSFGTGKEDGNLYADGTWNPNKTNRDRVCQASGTNNNSGNFMQANPSCPFPSGKLGQLVMKSGNTVTGYETCFALKAGQRFELRINDGDISDNSGFLQLRFVPSSVNQAINNRINYDSAGAPLASTELKDN